MIVERNVAETCREQGGMFTMVHWEDNLGVIIPSKPEERIMLQEKEKVKQSHSKCR